MRDSATERLTAAAARLFQERGLTRVGINEITREADVARMSLYNNFNSKEDLALAAYAAVSKSRQNAVDAAMAAADGPKPRSLPFSTLPPDWLAERHSEGASSSTSRLTLHSMTHGCLTWCVVTRRHFAAGSHALQNRRERPIRRPSQGNFSRFGTDPLPTPSSKVTRRPLQRRVRLPNIS